MPKSINWFFCDNLKAVWINIGLALYLNYILPSSILKAMLVNKYVILPTSWTKGMRIEHVSKLLGQANISTTQIYAKIVNDELDKAMSVFE